MHLNSSDNNHSTELVCLKSNSCQVISKGFEPTLLNYPVSDPRVNALYMWGKQIFQAKKKKRKKEKKAPVFCS